MVLIVSSSLWDVIVVLGCFLHFPTLSFGRRFGFWCSFPWVSFCWAHPNLLSNFRKLLRQLFANRCLLAFLWCRLNWGNWGRLGWGNNFINLGLVLIQHVLGFFRFLIDQVQDSSFFFLLVLPLFLSFFLLSCFSFASLILSLTLSLTLSFSLSLTLTFAVTGRTHFIIRNIFFLVWVIFLLPCSLAYFLLCLFFSPKENLKEQGTLLREY